MSYFIFTDDVNNTHVFDDCDTEMIMEIYDTFVSFVEVEVNKDDYVVGRFYYNDMTDYRESTPIEFNTLDDLYSYHQTQNGDGHYILDSYQLVKDGKVVDYKVVSDRFEYNDDGMTYLTDTEGYFTLDVLPSDGNFDECMSRMKEYDKTLSVC